MKVDSARGSGVQTEGLIRQEGSVGGADPSTHGAADVYQIHGRTVYNVCLRVTGNFHMAEDAAQATFLIYLRKAAALRRHSDLGGWFYQTAEFVARTTLRGNLRRRRNEPAIAQTKQVAHSTHDTLGWNEIRPRIDGEIAWLREIYRAPIIKVYFEGKSQKEAARALNVPEGTLRRRLFHAIQTLRKRLAGDKREVSALILTGLLADQANAAVVPTGLYAKFAMPSALSPAAARAVWLATTGAKIKTLTVVAAFALLVSAVTFGAFHASSNTAPNSVTKSQQPRAKSYSVGPWIIVSDLDERRTDRLIDHYIRDAAAKVQSQLFGHAVIRDQVTLYLFKDHDNLNHWGHSKGELLFGGKFPNMSSHDAFLVHDAANVEVLNMEAGDGFLLGRIVYQICNADAPKLPRWFKDGIAGSCGTSCQLVRLSQGASRYIARMKEYRNDVETARAIDLAELLAISDDDYRAGYERYHRIETAAICFVQWLQCTDRFASFYAEMKANNGATGPSTIEINEPEFLAWLQDVCATKQFRFERNGKSYMIDVSEDVDQGF